MPDNIGGIALRGYVKANSASAAKGLGNGQVDGGVDLVFTSVLPWKLSGILLHSSTGYYATRKGTHPVALDLKDEFRSGLGVAFPKSGIKMGAGTMQGIIEYVTGTFVGC